MTLQSVVRGLGVMALLIAVGCGGSQEPPPEYGYGDMFVDSSVSRQSVATGSSSPGYGGEAEYAATEGDYDDMEAEEAEPREYSVAEEPDMASPAPAADSGGWGGRRGRRERASRRAPPAPPPPPAQPAPAAAPSEPAVQAATAPTGGEAGATTPTPEPVDGTESGRQPAPTAEGERAAPLMIYEATLGLAVHEVSERIDEVVRITYEMGGFMQSQSDTSVIVRVPAPRFREALGRFEALGDVTQRRISAQDVSEQVRDIRIRLRNAIQMRDRLAQLLEQAQTVPESLIIEHELERLNETIALMQGQLEAFEDRIAFSTITVSFQAIQDESEVPRETFRLPFPWLDELGLQFLMQL